MEENDKVLSASEKNLNEINNTPAFPPSQK
jgi:hypothetical protein